MGQTGRDYAHVIEDCCNACMYTQRGQTATPQASLVVALSSFSALDFVTLNNDLSLWFA